ncbi:hypothetical protein DERP_006340 [Dermatophagoides pteronyssinus]|uniref:Uncharacterized protein n=1 Tax=Dermatophagoides pteronyssinus TaxID=6956 RepID=A0ABQ8IY56_DERPT|nr:hypothetical protein DERP_006340 [Dermatophagoides pteronyssinus]
MPLGTHQKIFLGWLFFGSFGIASFVYIKSGYFIDRDEAIKVREKIRQKLEEEDK